MQELLNTIEGFGSPRIAIVGDFMLDRYVYGDVERINPEAPVPVLRIVRSETSVGGSGNPATAIVALGGQAVCVGVVGKDAGGEELASMLLAAGADTSGLVRLAGRPTSVKTRYVGLAQHRMAQQILRVDEESTEPINSDVKTTLRAAVRSHLADCKVLAVEDYNKGVLNDDNTPLLIEDAVKAGLAVIVDPALGVNYRRYRSATLLTPNRYEASQASGVEITDDASLAAAGKRILDITDAAAVLITLDKEGAYLHEKSGEGRRIPHWHPREVYDVTGAGDVVLAMLAVAVAEGCDFAQAAALANVAGGLEVERFGVVPIKRSEVVDEMHMTLGQRAGKVIGRKQLAERISQRKAKGETIVFTNGCFDLLHMGHVNYLQQARDLGNCLIVAINSDDSVRRLKGPSRPIIGEAERGKMLAAMECVDYVTIFDEDTATELLELLKPDMQVKGGTTPEVVEREIVESYGGKAVTLDAVEGLSTTKIIDQILDSHNGKES